MIEAKPRIQAITLIRHGPSEFRRFASRARVTSLDFDREMCRAKRLLILIVVAGQVFEPC